MSSRVKPNEACFPSANITLVSNPGQPGMGNTTFAESSQNEEVNKELLQAVEGIYSPVLKVMKIFGMYFGDVTFNHLSQCSPSFRKPSYISRLYCGVVVVGLWFNAAMTLVSMFFGIDFYMLGTFFMWCLLTALKGTICLIVLPLTDARESRFKKFICKVMTIHTNNVKMEKVRSKMRTYLIMLFFFFVCTLVAAIMVEIQMDVNIGNVEPWNAWFGFKITYLLFLVIGAGVWLLPLLFFSLTCLIMESIFDDLHERKSAMDVSSLMMEHQRLCEVVEFADRTLSFLLLVIVGSNIPFICFAFYHVVNLPKQGTLAFIIVDLTWLLATAAALTVVMVFGSRVSEKVGIGNQFIVSYMSVFLVAFSLV